jgi:hypothetical protein
MKYDQEKKGLVPNTSTFLHTTLAVEAYLAEGEILL